MDFKARMAAAAARNKQHLATAATELQIEAPKPALPAHVTYLGERNGKPHYRVMPTIEHKPTFAEKMARWAESRAEQHRVGGACPHCQGTGRYRLHTQPGSNNKCYRCNGKGRLDTKDMAYLNRRLGGAGPICWVQTAAAA